MSHKSCVFSFIFLKKKLLLKQKSYYFIMDQVMSANQAKFASELLKITEAGESVVISPLSISCSLAMILLGAKHVTAEEIRHVLAEGKDSG